MNIVIIEDEELTAEDLESQILRYSDDISVVAKLQSVDEGIRYFKENPLPDLIFSDIQLQDGVSFEIYRSIQLNCPIVFCTAYDDFGLEAIKNNGIDYILKPFAKEDVFKALEKYFQLKKSFASSESSMQQLLTDIGQLRKINSILIYHKDKIIPLRIDDIVLFYKENEITYVRNKDGKSFAVDQTMDYFESVVGQHFFRANRQTIIQRDFIQETVSMLNRKLEIIPKQSVQFKLEVSRNRVSDFLDWLTRV